MIHRRAVRALLLASTVVVARPAFAQDAAADAPAPDTSIIVTAKATRSVTAIPRVEIQKILPGVSPLKAIETLPGVLYVSADPWGNNEQNAQIFIHGFNYQQLGFTMDGVPLGDQSYGNYNGLSPQRAVISEDVGRVVVATGAGDLATASTSNLGGTVDTFSSDPDHEAALHVAQTLGSYDTSRTYLRIDTGDLGHDTRAYVSVARQHARAWDFYGYQGGWQVNTKLVHDDSFGKLTAYFDFSTKKEPNEDATVIYKPSAGGTATAAQLYAPYTRPYLYPNLSAMTSYSDAYGNTPAANGSNYNDYYSDAQRTDYLGYLRYDARLSSHVRWNTMFYAHHDDGVGVVNGPLGQSITVIQAYLDPTYATDTHFKTNGNGAGNAALGKVLVAATGGSGLVTRTTEYRIDREGGTTALTADFGAHHVEAGLWFEHNSATQWRRWYAVPISNPGAYSPYIAPLDVADPLFTQYQGEARVNDLQLHLQDDWKLLKRLTIEAGFKTSAQWANGYFPIQPVSGSLSGLAGGLPSGRINTLRWFLPAAGGTYDVNGHETLYVNVQKNLHQYMTYLGGGSLSPWFQGSQSAFNAFAQGGQPETSWTYEGGLRTHRLFAGGIGLDAQINYYHVVFNNRLLSIPANPGGIAGGAIAGGTSLLVNVGAVHTDGVDAAFTWHFGHDLSLYNATSYNSSVYKSDYTSTASGVGAATGTCIGGFVTVGGTVPTCGKQVPGSPKWMNKTVATLDHGPFEVQVIGDYVGRRFATYTDDTSVRSYFLTSLRVAAHLPGDFGKLHHAELSLNITNLGDIHGASTISIGSATNSYSVYPIAPRQWFTTLALGF